MNPAYATPRDQWSAFHPNEMTNEREQAAQDYQSTCAHNHQPCPTRRYAMCCTRCGDWHWQHGSPLTKTAAVAA